jgi:hypothetical protein
MKPTARYAANVRQALAQLRDLFWSAIFVLLVAAIAADAFKDLT